MRTVILALLLICVAVPAIAVIEIVSARYDEKGRVLVEMRPIFEAFGATVTWDGALQEIRAVRGASEIVMHLNDHRAFVDGAPMYLDVPPRLVANTTRVPLRFIANAFGASVEYEGDRVRIHIPGERVLLVHLRGSFQPTSGTTVPGNWPWGSTRRVTDTDLEGWSNWDLTLIRNEIYARHGRPFENGYVRDYFLGRPWYMPNSKFRESWLTGLEQSNAAFIRDYQLRKYGTAATSP